MRPVTWSPSAVRDVARVHRYITDFNSAAAARIAAELLRSTDLLQQHPYAGRTAAAGTRELIVGDYVIVYRARVSGTRILRVWHGRQDRTG